MIATTLPIKFSDVCLELYGSPNTIGKSLSQAFTDAVSSSFDATYENINGYRNSLQNFRGYGGVQIAYYLVALKEESTYSGTTPIIYGKSAFSNVLAAAWTSASSIYGKEATELIINQVGHYNSAANIAKHYDATVDFIIDENGSYFLYYTKDWWLPNIWELTKLYQSLTIVNPALVANGGTPYNQDNLPEGVYWSTTEMWQSPSDGALSLRSYLTGSSMLSDKTSLYRVRAMKKIYAPEGLYVVGDYIALEKGVICYVGEII